jgi:hypothetical protein
MVVAERPVAAVPEVLRMLGVLPMVLLKVLSEAETDR